MLLLVEDDEMLGSAVRDGLSGRFAVDWVRTCEDAETALKTGVYDIAVVDLSLPDGDGLELVRNARRRGLELPVLIVTARHATHQRIAGLREGADDYIGKPFDMEELLARCEAAVRRSRRQVAPVQTLGDIVYDVAGHSVTRNGEAVNLSASELRVFDVLFTHAGRIVSKAQLEERLYAWSGEVESNTVEVYISRLRRKIGADVIRTVRGLGYMMQVSP